MLHNKLFSHFLVVTGLVLSFFVSGCSDTPPSIVLDMSEGRVIDYDNDLVDGKITITGSVVKGTNAIIGVWANPDPTVPEAKWVQLELTGNEFSYDFIPDAPGSDGITISTCTFKVADARLIRNEERISFIMGGSANQGVAYKPPTFNGEGAVEDAATVLLNEELLNVMTQAAMDIVNTELNDLIADELPRTESMNGITVKITDFSVGNMSVGSIDIPDAETYPPIITAINVDVNNVVIDGEIVGNVTLPFTINLGDIHWDEMGTEVFIKENTNDIAIRLNADNFGPAFWSQIDIEWHIGGGFLGAILEAFLNLIVGLFKILISFYFHFILNTIQIPLIDVNDIGMTLDTGGMDLMGITLDMSMFIGAWFPNAEQKPAPKDNEYWIFETPGNSEMYIPAMGIAMTPTYVGANPLEYFYSTPGDGFPAAEELELGFNSQVDQNLTVAINDDLINMGSWAAMQTGFMEDLDLTSVFGSVAGELLWGTFRTAKVKVTLKTPVLADFGTAEPCDTEGDITTCSTGKFIIRDMVIEIEDLMASQLIDKVRMSLDMDLDLNLEASEDGKTVEAFVGGDTAPAIQYLYINNARMAGAANLANLVMTYVLDNVVLPALLTIDVPVVELYGAAIQPHVFCTEIDEYRNMILRLGVSEPEPEPEPAP